MPSFATRILVALALIAFGMGDAAYGALATLNGGTVRATADDNVGGLALNFYNYSTYPVSPSTTDGSAAVSFNYSFSSSATSATIRFSNVSVRIGDGDRLAELFTQIYFVLTESAQYTVTGSLLGASGATLDPQDNTLLDSYLYRIDDDSYPYREFEFHNGAGADLDLDGLDQGNSSFGTMGSTQGVLAAGSYIFYSAFAVRDQDRDAAATSLGASGFAELRLDTNAVPEPATLLIWLVMGAALHQGYPRRRR